MQGTFSEEYSGEPFLLLLAHNLPHISLFVFDEFKGHSDAGLENPEGYQLDGVSLTPLLENPDNSLNREALYWHFPGYPNSRWRTGPVSAVRSERWK
ncbi:hypothetical protein ACG2E4_18250, partial [Halalkalibaculum sp. DA384]